MRPAQNGRLIWVRVPGRGRNPPLASPAMPVMRLGGEICGDDGNWHTCLVEDEMFGGSNPPLRTMALIENKNGIETHLFPCDCSDACYLKVWVDRDEGYPSMLWIEQIHGRWTPFRGAWHRLKAAAEILYKGDFQSREIVLTKETTQELIELLKTL